MRRPLILFGLAWLLTACGNGPDSDLVAYIEQVKQNTRVAQQPQTGQKKHELFAYQADSDGIRDPFLSSQLPATVQVGGAGVLAPEQHEQGMLETIPLESLVYMGTIEKRGRRVALVRSSDGQVHQVRVGEYLGQNHGKVVEFDARQITVQELIPDGLGGWQARTATVGHGK